MQTSAHFRIQESPQAVSGAAEVLIEHGWLEAYAVKSRGHSNSVEVFNVIRGELIKCGAQENQIRHFATESESFDAALQWAADGDLVVMLDLGRDSDIQSKLKDQ